MAVTIESLTTDGPNFSKPTGLSEGDLMICVISDEDNSIPTAASGFTQIEEAQATGTDRDAVTRAFHKIATSSDVSASNFNFSNGGGVLYRISGSVTSASNINTASEVNTGGAAISGITFTPRHTNALLILGVANANNNVSSVSLDPGNITISGTGTDPTWTERFDSATNGQSDAVADAFYADTDTITGVDASYNSDDSECAVLLMIQEPNSETGTFSPVHASPTVNSGDETSGIHVTAPTFTVSPTINIPTAEATSKIWTNQNKNSTTWTNQTKNG